jgi:FAD/FMN-containing dehydrogenase
MTQLRTLDDGVTTLSPEALTAFRAGFRGQVLTPADAGYDEQRKIWNGMIDRKPGMIARCTGTADVVAAVKLAREHKLLFSVRGGGHNIAGLAVCEGGLMVDLSAMRGVIVDPAARIVRAQGGCLLGDVDRETQLHGQAAVLGFVSATGIAGLTTGGGFGYLTRQYGWTCDNVRSMEVVTAEGTVVTASADQNAELFWCLRGGSGNFGIVTAFEYPTYPVGPTILGGVMAWPAERAAEVMACYQQVSSTAPRQLTLVSMMRLAPPAPWLPKEIHGKPMVGILAFYDGKIADGEALIAPFRALGPIADICTARPYAQLQALLDAQQPKGRRYYWKSEYLGDLTPEAIATYRECAATIRSPHSAMIFFQLGGALNELPIEHSPMGNRATKYVLNVAAAWDPASEDATHVGWARDSWQAMRKYSTGGVYVNFLTEDEGPERIAAAYAGGTFEKLAALKRKYDPQGLFRHTKSFG